MRIEQPGHAMDVGHVRIHARQRVWELDSGGVANATAPPGTLQVSPHQIDAINRRMAIVVPCRNEPVGVVEGVLSGIPHDCLAIVVSNSDRRPVDRFAEEIDTITRFCGLVGRAALVVHQRDRGIARALAAVGLPELIDEKGLVRHGKGEGMLLGFLLARLAGSDFVGYVDGDNHSPGAVHEYVSAFAAGFHLRSAPQAMVRIDWGTKPKVEGTDLVFNRSGRVSEITNGLLNELLSSQSGTPTGIMATGNSGEHAFTIGLGERLRFAGGFAAEPHQIIDLISGSSRRPLAENSEAPVVEVFQITTRNPHLHRDRGPDHLQEMTVQALTALAQSCVCPAPLRRKVERMLLTDGRQDPSRPVPDAIPVYPAAEGIDWSRLRRVIEREAGTLERFGPGRPKADVERLGSSPDDLQNEMPAGA